MIEYVLILTDAIYVSAAATTQRREKKSSDMDDEEEEDGAAGTATSNPSSSSSVSRQSTTEKVESDVWEVISSHVMGHGCEFLIVLKNSVPYVLRWSKKYILLNE